MNPVTDATATSGFLKTANGQILGNNGTNNIGLFGFDDTGTMVVKVAKPGYDANSATDDQLIFNSAQNTFKIVKIIPMTVTVHAVLGVTDSYYNSSSVAHGLTYVPAFSAFIIVPVSLGSNPSLKLSNPALTYGTVGGALTIFSVSDVEVDDTNVYFATQLRPGTSTGDYTFTATVYLLQETFS